MWSSQGFLRGGVPTPNVLTLHLGVDTSLFYPTPPTQAGMLRRSNTRKRLGWEGRFVAFAVGAMTANKGMRELVSAFIGFLRAFEAGDLGHDHGRPLLALHGMDALYRYASRHDVSKWALPDSLPRCRSRQFVEFVPSELMANGDVVYDGDPVSFEEMAERYRVRAGIAHAQRGLPQRRWSSALVLVCRQLMCMCHRTMPRALTYQS